MIRSCFSGIVVLSLALGLSGTSWAKRDFKKLEEKLQNLNLTTDQNKLIEGIRDKHKEQSSTTKAAMKAAKAKFHDALRANLKPDELKSLHEAVIEAKTKMMRGRFDQMLAIRDVLTEPQRQQFQEFMKDHKGKHGHHSGDGE